MTYQQLSEDKAEPRNGLGVDRTVNMLHDRSYDASSLEEATGTPQPNDASALAADKIFMPKLSENMWDADWKKPGGIGRLGSCSSWDVFCYDD